MSCSPVVNCFRFVSLKYWTQYVISKVILYKCCELLSICIFEILNTVYGLRQWIIMVLWIAFDLYLWNIEHSFVECGQNGVLVVNCFRFVSLKYWTQSVDLTSLQETGCELLSICIFEILNTVAPTPENLSGQLWIAFDLYLWNIEHSKRIWKGTGSLVVNCFRFVSLKYWTQFRNCSEELIPRCELLSICIFEILNTVTNTVLSSLT